MNYCWPTSFKVLEVLFLGEVSSAFLPSKKTYRAPQFRYWGVDQQYPPVKSTHACRQSFANNGAKELGLKMHVQLTGLQEVFGRDTFQIPPN